MANVVQGPSLVSTHTHRPTPSLMFLPGLRSLPFWTSLSPDGTTNRIAYQDPMVTHVVQYLEDHVATFQKEYNNVHEKNLTSDYEDVGSEHLHEGDWDWHSYMTKGKLQGHFVTHFPETSAILQQLREEKLLFEGTPFGYSFFSTLHPKSSIRPHTGPMNFRLRLHLPLQVPSSGNCGIQVGPSATSWTEGRALVLDDSYMHHVWNETNETRVLLLVDVWHPDVSPSEKEEIMYMFAHAKEQGWLDGEKTSSYPPAPESS